MRPLRAVMLATVVAVTARDVCAAQMVRGTVRDSVTAAPIAGAAVSLLDRAGRPVARTISRANGAFSLDANGGGAVALRVLRIGYAPGRVAINDQVLTNVNVRLARLAAMLAPVEVQAAPPDCPQSPDRQRALALWEQVQFGFASVLAARDAAPARVRRIRFDRTLSIHGQEIVRQRVQRFDTTVTRPFFSARTAADLLRDGFLAETPKGREYFAPDADVLVDTAFENTHCFRLALRDDDHANALGIAFEPTRARRDLVDIAGTLWLDSASLALRSLHFRYTGIEPAAAGVGAGGDISFRESKNGVPFIDRWSIRVVEVSDPAFDSPRPPDAVGDAELPRSQRTHATVTAVHDVGGLVALVHWDDGSSYSAPLGTVSGHVRRKDGQTTRRFGVWLDGTDYSALTDSNGNYQIDEVLDGPYQVLAADSAFADFRASEIEGVATQVERDSLSRADVLLPPRAAALNLTCGGQRHADGDVTLFGRVSSAAPAGTQWHIDANWPAVDGLGLETLLHGERSGTTDSEGRFVLCGLPREAPIRIRVNRGRVADTIFALPPNRGAVGLTVLGHPN